MSKYKFRPYSFVNTKNPDGYFSGNPSFSYGTNVLVWMGARRCGKTFHALKYCVKNFLYKGYQFVWLRDNDEARTALSTNHGAKFFSDIKLMGFKQKVEGTIEGNTIYINGKTAGYIMPCSTFQNFKGNAFNEIKIVVYDEFIPERTTKKVEGRDWQSVNMIYTICSTRKDLRLLFLSNSLNKSDSLLQFLGLDCIKDYGLYINREKSVVLHYCDNSKEFIERRDDSVMGKLIKGSYMEDNLFNNKFLNEDEGLYYLKRPSGCKLDTILEDGYSSVRIYRGKDGKFYVGDDFNDQAYEDYRFVNNITLVNSKRTLLPKYKLDMFRNAYNAKLVLFNTAFAKETFVNVISKKR